MIDFDAPRLLKALVPTEAVMLVGVPRETIPGERRVALVPDLVPRLTKEGLDVLVEAGAGEDAGFPDASYVDKGARVGSSVLESADVVLKVQPPTTEEVERLKAGSALVGLLRPYEKLEAAIIMRGDWTIENGLLTPSMKIKRTEVEKIHLPKYPMWFNQKKAVVWE